MESLVLPWLIASSCSSKISLCSKTFLLIFAIVIHAMIIKAPTMKPSLHASRIKSSGFACCRQFPSPVPVPTPPVSFALVSARGRKIVNGSARSLGAILAGGRRLSDGRCARGGCLMEHGKESTRSAERRSHQPHESRGPQYQEEGGLSKSKFWDGARA